jgi:hypothetical protein
MIVTRNIDTQFLSCFHFRDSHWFHDEWLLKIKHNIGSNKILKVGEATSELVLWDLFLIISK